MKNVISLKDLEQMVRNGQSLSDLPAVAILTPSAREFLQDREMNVRKSASSGNGSVAGTNNVAPPSRPLNSKSPKSPSYFRNACSSNMMLVRPARRHSSRQPPSAESPLRKK